MHDNWKSSIVSVVMAAEGWAKLPTDVKFQRRYKQRLKEAYTFLTGFLRLCEIKRRSKSLEEPTLTR